MRIRIAVYAAVLLLLFSGAAAADDLLHLASWNVRILSDNSRDDTELRYIADILSRYDLIAIQEVRDERVLERLLRMLPEEWDYLVSDPAGRGVKELYAFMYDSSKVAPFGADYLLGDPNDLFIREPYIASFRAGSFDFVLITLHAVYGDSIFDRRGEAELLPHVITHIDDHYGPEKDIILLGDFNLPADDYAWDPFHDFYKPVIPAQVKTTITDTSSYDNIWLSASETFSREFTGNVEVYAFDEIIFSNDDRRASEYCSDHRPISILLQTAFDDDSSAASSSPAEPFFITPPYADDTGAAYASSAREGDVIIDLVISSPTERETVGLRNTTLQTVSLAGWTLGDKNSPDSYTIPGRTDIQPGQLLLIDHSMLNFIINNRDEELYLKRPDGILIDMWSDR
jgi:deoxyribonuclease-1-like protein